MAFRFSLDSLLRFRQGVEHQHELRLRAANQQVAQVRRLLEQIDRGLLETQRRRRRHLLEGVTSAEVRFELDSEAVLEAKRKDVESELLRMTQLRDRQLVNFQHARRDREIIENLRYQQLREYTRKTKRFEQRSLDDIFLLRQSYLRRG